MNERVVLDAVGIGDAVERMASDLAQRPGDGPWAVVGIHRGGDHVATRLADALRRRTGQPTPVGGVDITLYRDDGYGRHEWPEVGATRIDFDQRRHTVVLVDDVLYTGRTVRAAIDAILDYGRPRAVRLAVLVDRGLHELPIRADAVGLVLETTAAEHVDVQLVERGADVDAVVVAERGPTPERAP